MMAARLLLTIAFCILSGSALAQNVYVKAGTIGRFDYDTNGKRTRTPESIYTNAVLQMPFSYDDGSPYYDCSKSNNDGTQTTAGFRPLWTNGWDGAYNFDGADDYIVSAYVPPTSTWTGITYSAWVYADSFSPQSFAFIMGGVVGADLILRRTTAGGAFQFFDGVSDFIVSDSAITGQAWVHVVGTIDGADDVMRMYVNGVLQTDTEVSANWSHFTTFIRVGFSGVEATSQYWDGMIDDTRVYDRNLSTAEVLAMYNAEPLIANGGKR